MENDCRIGGEKMLTNEVTNAPRMLTIREAARTGILPEHAIRQGVKRGEIPHITVGNKALINFDKLVQMLNNC